MSAEIIIKIRNFFKKHKRAIAIIIIVWVIVIVVNNFLKNAPQIDVPITTYKPHTTVMDNAEVPQELQSPIEEAIKNFVAACNEKDYEKAYELLTKDCQENTFKDIDTFKLYVDTVFDKKKIYNIQAFSNKGDYYIYTVTILNDIMASGLNEEGDTATYEETYVLKKEDGQIKLAIRGYIGNSKIDQMFEDEYMKITIEDVKTDYETVTYYMKVRNKTNDIVVLEDFSEKYEVVLDTDMGYRKRYGFYIEPIIVYPEHTKTYELTFTRFYDETGNINSLIFNDVRILKSYTGTEETRQEELEGATARYSLTLDL